jgi:hypothetical protein
MNIVEAFVVHQAVAMILTAKPFDFALLMLKRASVNAVRHPDVKRAERLHMM